MAPSRRREPTQSPSPSEDEHKSRRRRHRDSSDGGGRGKSRNSYKPREQRSSRVDDEDSDSDHRTRRSRRSDDGREDRERRPYRDEDGTGNLGTKPKENTIRDKDMKAVRSQDIRKHNRRQEHCSSSSGETDSDDGMIRSRRSDDGREDRERGSNRHKEGASKLGASRKADIRREKEMKDVRSQDDRKENRPEESSSRPNGDSDSDYYRMRSRHRHSSDGEYDRERRSNHDEVGAGNIGAKWKEDSRREKEMMDGQSRDDREHNRRVQHSSSSSEGSDRRGGDDRGDHREQRSNRNGGDINFRVKKKDYERDREMDGQAYFHGERNHREDHSSSSGEYSNRDAHRRRSKDEHQSRAHGRNEQQDGRLKDGSEDWRELNGGRDLKIDDHQSKKREREQKSDANAHRRRDAHRNGTHFEKDRENGRQRDGHGDHRSDHQEKKRDDKNYSHRRENHRESDRQIRERDRERLEEEEIKKPVEAALPPPPPLPEANLGRSGGVYIPPHKMAQMMREVQDKNSEAYQRMSWDALRKSINGLVNKVNATNIKNIIPELFSENLIRSRGLFCRSCMKSQMASPGFTDVFAALVAVVNTKFPEVGKLLLKRIVLQLKRAYKRNDKPQLLAATKFIAHLVNQQVAHEIVALELLTVLLENPTDDSVEVAVGFVKECGSLLQDFSPLGLHGIFERFRGILHEGEIDKRVQFLIEGLFAIRKAKFQGYPAVRPELDLVEQEDQFTHEISLEDEVDPETHLDVFKVNPQFLEDEKAYENLKKNILGAESSEEEEDSDAVSGDDDDEEESEEEEDEEMKIKDETETNLVNLRRTIYLTIMSSVDFEEAGHKLLKIKLEPGQEMELCIMLLECCSQERTYLRYYGLLGQRFCMINKIHQENFEKCFLQQYSMIHRLETNKLRNVAKFFAHLLGTDALSWHVLAYIRLTEEDTTSSSRIFIKILFQELSEHLGIRLLNERLNDPTMQESFESIFPKDNPKNTRFSINFFTSIGLGGITENLREYLKNMPRLIMQQQKPASESDSESESASDSDSASSGSQTESGSESESDSSSESKSSSDGSERYRQRKKRKGT